MVLNTTVFDIQSHSRRSALDQPPETVTSTVDVRSMIATEDWRKRFFALPHARTYWPIQISSPKWPIC